MYTDPLLGLAVNKAIRDLYLFARVNTTILDATTFILGVGDFSGQAAAEYPLLPNTLWVQGVNLDGIPLGGPLSEDEMQNTGMEQVDQVASLGTRSYYVRTEEDGSKTLELFPRPKVGQKLRAFGGIAPDYLTDNAQVPVIGEVYGDPIEFYAVWYLIKGQEGMTEKASEFFADYMTARNKAKLGLRLDRTFKTRRVRTP